MRLTARDVLLAGAFWLVVLLMGCKQETPGESLDTRISAVQPAPCDPFVDNVGPVPANKVDLAYPYANDCGMPYGTFRFGAIDLDTAWSWYCPFGSGTAGVGTYVWLCANDTPRPLVNGCNGTTSSSPGIPGPSWAPCWKANTTSKFRRLFPGQFGSNFVADTGGGQTSILVSNQPLPAPPICPGTVAKVNFTACGTISDSGYAEYSVTNTMGAHRTGTWPSGQTGAPCTDFGPDGHTTITIVYNCPVEPRTHYDY